jgi:hypothetical protein
MTQTYSDACVTIVASAANDAAEGFLQPRPAATDLITPPFRVSSNTFGSVKVDCNSDLYEFGASEPIDKRAWTLQEHMISRRLLQYTSQTLQWRCAITTVNLGESLYWENTYDPRAKILSQIPKSQQEAYNEWLRIVQDYSWPSDLLRSLDIIMLVYGNTSY